MPRRFIAGATCPSCKAIDKLVVDTESDKRECVACGFSEDRPDVGGPSELPTRVTRPAARRVETEATVVRLVDVSVNDDNQDGG